MQKIDTRYASPAREDTSALQPGDMQVVFSNTLRMLAGDMAVTYGFHAVEVDSQVGRSHHGVSDAHDLVIAKVTAE